MDMAEPPATELAHYILARDLSPGDPTTAAMVAEGHRLVRERLAAAAARGRSGPLPRNAYR